MNNNMKILLLGGEKKPKIYDFLCDCEEEVIFESKKLNFEEIQSINPDFIISYNYKHIIKFDVINAYKGKIINLHISLLPWNRGGHPNLWSFWDNTPKGITIHHIDEGIDTGEIIVQKEVDFDSNYLELTLKETYDILQEEIQELFMEKWQEIKLAGTNRATRHSQDSSNKANQTKEGSFHYAKDLGSIWQKLGNRGGGTAA